MAPALGRHVTAATIPLTVVSIPADSVHGFPMAESYILDASMSTEMYGSIASSIYCIYNRVCFIEHVRLKLQLIASMARCLQHHPRPFDLCSARLFGPLGTP